MFLLAQLPVEELKAQLGNGIILMILGMAIVFLFLTILVFTTKSVSGIVKKYERKLPAKSVTQPAVSQTSASEAEIAAVIAAAVVKSDFQNKA